MDDFRIWQPLSRVNPTKYLYHYTSFSTALKILYHRTLRFSGISGTNDSLEQKPKLKCVTNDPGFLKYYKQAKDIFSETQKKFKLLCFSTDPDFKAMSAQYFEMQQYLSSDQMRQNVNGRGFALPRMWAQYADNNRGVCFVIDKGKLDCIIEENGIEVTQKPVKYNDYYIPLEITESDKDIIRSISSNDTEAETMVLSFIRQNSKFVDFHFFTKLKDWENEHEYRYITFQSNAEKDTFIDIHEIQKCICGVVLGASVNDVDKKIIELLLAYLDRGIPLKQLEYCDLTTRIIPISYNYHSSP